MFFLHLFLFLIVYSINKYYDRKEEERKELHKLCDEILRDNHRTRRNKTRRKNKDIEEEGELFFSDATDLDDDFK